MLSSCGASVVIYSETRAGWWHDEAVGFLIAAFMNENLQVYKLRCTSTHTHTEEFKSWMRVQGRGTLDGALKFMCEWKLWGCFCCVFTGFQLP